MIASTWYCIAQTSTFDTGCTINVAFDGYDIQFSASVKFGMSAINITRCNIPYDTVFSLRLREGASQWFVDIFCSKEITPNVSIADSPYWAEVNTTAGAGNIILSLNDITSKYNTEQGGAGGFDVDQLKQFLFYNGYTALLDYWKIDEVDNTVLRTDFNVVSRQEIISQRRATGAGSGTGSGYGRLDNWAEWDADTMMTYVLSAKLGVSLNERLKNIELNGSGLKEDDLKKYLDDNKYLQEGDIAELKATVDGLDDLLNGGTKEVIDTWNEVVSFLDGYKDSEDLATILSGMNTDIANRVLIEDFEKLEEAVLAIDISGLSNRLDVAEQAIKTNATAIATNTTNITNLNNRVKTLEDLGLTLEGDAETGYYIKSAYSFVSQGEIISGRRASGSGSGGGGGISEITAQMITDALGYVPYSSLNPDGYITSSALNGYAKTSDIPSLSGYATQTWVGDNYQPKGNYLTSVTWDIVGGKPTTLGGYGIADAYTASVIDSKLSGYLPLSGGKMANNAGIEWTYNAHSWDAPADGFEAISTANDNLGYYSGISYKGYYGLQIRAYGGNTDQIEVRGFNHVNWGTWRDIIHSGNIGSYNAGSATKLQNARTIWGQSFDGTQNVSGKLSNATAISFDTGCGVYQGSTFSGSMSKYDIAYYGTNHYFHNFSGGYKLIIKENGNVLVGTTTDWGYKLGVYGATFITGNADHGILIGAGSNTIDAWRVGGNSTDLFLNWQSSGHIKMVTGGGNVLIGTTDDNGAKLQVNGNADVDGGLYINNKVRLHSNDGAELYVNYGGGANNGNLYLCGYNVRMFYGTSSKYSVGFQLNSSGNVLIGTTTDNGAKLQVNGNLVATGEVISSRRATSSDARLKDNINRLIADDCLAMVRNLQPSSWQWKEDGKFSLGFIAQDIEPLMPYAVTKIKDEELGQRLNLQYDQFFAPVVGAIQCLDSEVEQLKRRVKYLENKLQEYGYNRY